MSPTGLEQLMQPFKGGLIPCFSLDSAEVGLKSCDASDRANTTQGYTEERLLLSYSASDWAPSFFSLLICFFITFQIQTLTHRLLVLFTNIKAKPL